MVGERSLNHVAPIQNTKLNRLSCQHRQTLSSSFSLKYSACPSFTPKQSADIRRQNELCYPQVPRFKNCIVLKNVSSTQEGVHLNISSICHDFYNFSFSCKRGSKTKQTGIKDIWGNSSSEEREVRRNV
ncbi:hypothetical protein AMECASPLE_007614 [Ameca splendens]|uniref:Uncharacterized protein n=1 Tax=Ameca splendens TaxID=208324 RepID=A0ABV0XNU3_9TELE